ncbi:MAG: hypothetical protein Q8P67_00220 [archaeon]|nr:hypothetical protein [archaeon]
MGAASEGSPSSSPSRGSLPFSPVPLLLLLLLLLPPLLLLSEACPNVA